MTHKKGHDKKKQGYQCSTATHIAWSLKPDERAKLTGDEFFIPLEGSVDLEKEKEEAEKELAYTKGFLKSIEKKLSNERFVNNAPEQVVAMEKKKMEDAQAKIKVLEESLSSFRLTLR